MTSIGRTCGGVQGVSKLASAASILKPSDGLWCLITRPYSILSSDSCSAVCCRSLDLDMISACAGLDCCELDEQPPPLCRLNVIWRIVLPWLFASIWGMERAWVGMSLSVALRTSAGVSARATVVSTPCEGPRRFCASLSIKLLVGPPHFRARMQPMHSTNGEKWHFHRRRYQSAVQYQFLRWCLQGLQFGRDAVALLLRLDDDGEGSNIENVIKMKPAVELRGE